MDGPKRILDDPSIDPLARSLLKEAAGEVAAPAIKAKTIAALGLPAAASGAGASAGAFGVWKAMTIGALLVGGAATWTMTQTPPSPLTSAPNTGVALSASAVSASETPTSETPALKLPTSDMPSPMTPIPVASNPVAPAQSGRTIGPTLRTARPALASSIGALHEHGPPAATSALAGATPDVTEATPPKESPSPVRPSAEPRAEASLAAEAHVLERARLEIVEHRAAAALATLDGYDRSFPFGSLRPEATALRVEALATAGDRSAARSLGAHFLAKYPEHPAASRVRRAMDGTNP